MDFVHMFDCMHFQSFENNRASTIQERGLKLEKNVLFVAFETSKKII
jgi:hypothetical protein